MLVVQRGFDFAVWPKGLLPQRRRMLLPKLCQSMGYQNNLPKNLKSLLDA